MNFRGKSTALVLCFFLGLLGAHWFYLGRRWRGSFYLLTSLAVFPGVLFWPFLWNAWAAWTGTALGLFHLVPLLLPFPLVCVLTVCDFFHLLTIDPQRFDSRYNR